MLQGFTVVFVLVIVSLFVFSFHHLSVSFSHNDNHISDFVNISMFLIFNTVAEAFCLVLSRHQQPNSRSNCQEIL